VRTYAQIAAAVGKPKGMRAVGQANRANPLPILIPCHRVVGKGGDLVGYAGSRTDLKAMLLRLEGVLPG
ncbi:MAG: MGMT family protein, partial [Alicyclobacillaceae bacterium]|nr:MGMT family protein [Alicyclobacillaceae bacterium]